MSRKPTAVTDAADAEDQAGAIVVAGGRDFCASAHREMLAAVDQIAADGIISGVARNGTCRSSYRGG